jgi:hypothetical protein
MFMPVHSRTGLIKNLHPVHANILTAASCLFCKNKRKRKKTAGILRPTFQNRQRKQVRFPLNHLLTGTPAP